MTRADVPYLTSFDLNVSDDGAVKVNSTSEFRLQVYLPVYE
jgi:hypothetical protein